MSKSMNMLRTRRKDNNVKPNRRLDRKSSRGMIYENEELRLKTININAEIERGQSDIKKLRRENEMLKKEIWCLRDEYEKLDKLLKDKDVDFSSSCTSDSESCSSCTEESEEVETSQNMQNFQKTNIKKLHVEFDHLSIVPEENSTENSDRNSVPTSIPNDAVNVIKPDQGYPDFPPKPIHFFSPLPRSNHQDFNPTNSYYTFQHESDDFDLIPLAKTSSDVIVKLDNHNFNSFHSRRSFSNGGNLEELLNDIETISQDILKISGEDLQESSEEIPYKSELNVVLMPTPMPLIGFEKYHNLSCESIPRAHYHVEEPDLEKYGQQILTQQVLTTQQDLALSQQDLSQQVLSPPRLSPSPIPGSSFINGETFIFQPAKLDDIKPPVETCNSRSNLLEAPSSDHVSSENEENLRFNTEEKKTKSKMSIRRKVSIHFKGKKEKEKEKKVEKKGLEVPAIDLHRHTPSLDAKKSLEELNRDLFKDLQKDKDLKKHNSLELKSSGSERNSQNLEKKQRKSVSISPDRKHSHHKTDDKRHKKNKKLEKFRQRRSTISTDGVQNRERSFSICTDKSNILEHNFGNCSAGEEYLTSDRERTNSLSSCGTVRKMSTISNFPVSGKIPWCACWGNGCL